MNDAKRKATTDPDLQSTRRMLAEAVRDAQEQATKHVRNLHRLFEDDAYRSIFSALERAGDSGCSNGMTWRS